MLENGVKTQEKGGCGKCLCALFTVALIIGLCSAGYFLKDEIQEQFNKFTSGGDADNSTATVTTDLSERLTTTTTTTTQATTEEQTERVTERTEDPSNDFDSMEELEDIFNKIKQNIPNKASGGDADNSTATVTTDLSERLTTTTTSTTTQATTEEQTERVTERTTNDYDSIKEIEDIYNRIINIPNISDEGEDEDFTGIEEDTEDGKEVKGPKSATDDEDYAESSGGY